MPMNTGEPQTAEAQEHYRIQSVGGTKKPKDASCNKAVPISTVVSTTTSDMNIDKKHNAR